MTLIVICLSLSILMLAFILSLKEMNKHLAQYVSIMTSTTQDSAVDEFFMKAVAISVDMYRNDKAVGIELEKKIVERACVIASDVLMQHKIPPRKYNLEGMTRLAMIKHGLIELKRR